MIEQPTRSAQPTCHLCGAAVEGAALVVQRSAQRAGRLDQWRCRAHLLEAPDRLMLAIRAHREAGE